MSNALNFQLSIFGKYSVHPDPQIITSLMAVINQATGQIFLPNIVNSQQVEIPANRITIISNLGFVTQDQRFNITILDERIDINYNMVPNQEIDMQTFYSLSAKAMEAIMSNLGLRAYRLAANAQLIINLSDLSQTEAVGKKIIKSAEYYNDKTLCEWSTRVNSQTHIDILGKTEEINVITDISTLQSSPERQTSVLYHIDINTLPQNPELRFNHEALNPFVEKIMPISAEVISGIERLIVSE